MKYCLGAVFFISLLFSAQGIWAQGKAALKSSRASVSVPAALRGKRPVSVPTATRFLSTVPSHITRSVHIPSVPTEVIAARVANAQYIHNQQLARALAKPQFFGQPVSVPSTKLIYRGVEVTELKQDDRILLWGAYDSQHRPVAYGQSRLPNGQPILLSEAEKSLLGYDIDMVVFIIRNGATTGKLAHPTRVVTHYPKTQKTTIVIQKKQP